MLLVSRASRPHSRIGERFGWNCDTLELEVWQTSATHRLLAPHEVCRGVPFQSAVNTTVVGGEEGAVRNRERHRRRPCGKRWCALQECMTRALGSAPADVRLHRAADDTILLRDCRSERSVGYR